MSGLLITAVAPGGQGDGVAVLSAVATAMGGGAGMATAGVGAGSGSGNAAVSTRIAGGGVFVARAGAETGRGAASSVAVPVMLGASAIGPDAGSAIVGGPMSAAARGAGCSIGEHARSQSGIATMIAADPSTPTPGIPRLDFPVRAVAELLISGMASSGVISPEDYSLPVLYGTTRERSAHSTVSSSPKIARHKSAAR